MTKQEEIDRLRLLLRKCAQYLANDQKAQEEWFNFDYHELVSELREEFK